MGFQIVRESGHFQHRMPADSTGLLGVTGQGDPGQHVGLEALNPSAYLQVRPGHRNMRHHIGEWWRGNRGADELLEKGLNLVLLLFFSASGAAAPAATCTQTHSQAKQALQANATDTHSERHRQLQTPHTSAL